MRPTPRAGKIVKISTAMAENAKRLTDLTTFFSLEKVHNHDLHIALLTCLLHIIKFVQLFVMQSPHNEGSCYFGE